MRKEMTAMKAASMTARADANTADGNCAPTADNSTETASAQTAAGKNQMRRNLKMKGFIYRLGTYIKNAGERRHIGALVRMGFMIRELV
jgi:hypothetical protein